MSLPKITESSFTDDIGATTSIPAERISLYAIVKAEQAAVLSHFVADYTAGFKIELTESEVSIFAAVVRDLAAASRAATSGLSEALEEMQEGGRK